MIKQFPTPSDRSKAFFYDWNGKFNIESIPKTS